MCIRDRRQTDKRHAYNISCAAVGDKRNHCGNHRKQAESYHYSADKLRCESGGRAESKEKSECIFSFKAVYKLSLIHI